LINAYKKIKENPCQTIINRILVTKEVKSHFAEADVILKERPDNLIEHFQEDSSVFWQQYKSARRIIYHCHRKRTEKLNEELHIYEAAAQIKDICRKSIPANI